MELYLGGFSQGKLEYVCNEMQEGSYQIYDGEKMGEETLEKAHFSKQETIIFYHFHLWFRRKLSQGESPEEIMDAFLVSCPDLIIISDEVGNGVVPMGREEREYRERLGRYLCKAAKKADKVVRVMCGIGQRIK